MHQSSVTQIRKSFVPAAAACFLVLGCILFAAAANSGSGRAPAPYGQTSKSEPKAASNQTSGTEETRTLLRELESQAEVQRDQLQKTEISLRRARAILTELERVQQPQDAISPARSSKHTFNPNDPMQGETLSQQALAEKTPWAWPVETATPEACARHFGGGYDVEFKSPDVPSLPPTVEVQKTAIRSCPGVHTPRRSSCEGAIRFITPNSVPIPPAVASSLITSITANDGRPRSGASARSVTRCTRTAST